MLWLCLYFPRLGLEIFTRGRAPNAALIVCEGQGRERRVLHADTVAARCGIAPGLRVSAARALAEPLHIVSRDEPAEHEALHNLASWSGQFSSLVHVVEAQALLLEIGGSLRLFHGLERLLRRIERGLRELGYTAQTAVAPVKLAAVWLARAAPGSRITEPSRLAGALSGLPLSVLELSTEQRARLHGMGIARIGDCRRLPRDGLAKRFGAALVLQLDRAHGHHADPRTPFVPPERFAARIELPGTVEHVEGLLFGVNRLVAELCGWLRARSAGATALTLMLAHPKHTATHIELGLVAPSRESKHLTELLRERLARTALPAAVEALRLELAQQQSLGTPTRELFAARRSEDASAAMLIERLRVRLGADTVVGLRTVADHRPEYGQICVQAESAAVHAATTHSIDTPPRPFWLLPEPVPLEHVGEQPYLDGRLELAGTAERIESGWWDGADARRDYYVVRCANGQRAWAFLPAGEDSGWMLHGWFA